MSNAPDETIPHPFGRDPEPEPEQVKPSTDDVLDSITGYDEIALSKAFGANVTELARKEPTTFVRALAFVIYVHEGQTATDAHKRVMSMTLGAVNDLFSDVDDDDLPGSETGKGDA